MAAPHRIFGSELSPYSVKVRSYFRYKGIAHEWLERGPSNIAEYQKHAKLPLIPLVVTPEEQGLQDSTPILEAMERRFPEPSIHPSDPTLAFLSALIEEFGDEWGNKWMFHYRWARPVDQDSGAERIARSMRPDAHGEELAQLAAGVKERMVGRVWFVGSSATTAPLIEASYRDTSRILEKHLAARPYLFGARPAFADFGLWGQFYECWSDPTPGAILRKEAPRVTAWVERMLDPKAEGDFESWEALEPTLFPLLERQIGALFLPWSDANAKAIAAGQEEMSATLPARAAVSRGRASASDPRSEPKASEGGARGAGPRGGASASDPRSEPKASEGAVGRWTQKPQKYHARSLGELRKKYAAVADKSRLDPILERAGCLQWLRSAV